MISICGKFARDVGVYGSVRAQPPGPNGIVPLPAPWPHALGSLLQGFLVLERVVRRATFNA
jgi:hypothetical protein